MLKEKIEVGMRVITPLGQGDVLYVFEKELAKDIRVKVDNDGVIYGCHHSVIEEVTYE